MKSNTSWEVRAPTFSPARKNIHVMYPGDAEITELNNLSLVFTDGPFGDESRQQKGQEGVEDGLFNSSLRGHESYSSFASVGTDSGRDASRKSARSSRDTSKKTRRRARRRSSVGSTVSQVAFDPTRSPLKSCMKQTSQVDDLRQQQLRRKRGEFYKVHLPGKTGFVKRQRTIHFHDGVHVREVRSSLSLCKGEHRVLWWQDDEHAAIKENLQRLLARVNSKGVSKKNGRKYCTRGLERFLETKSDCEADRTEAEEAVFREQTHQRETGTFDEMRIAAVYFRRTRNSMKRASSRGIEDAAVALPIMTDGKDLRFSASTGSLNASIGMSPPNPKQTRRSSLSMLPRRGSLSFLRKPEERLKKSNSFRQTRPEVSTTA